MDGVILIKQDEHEVASSLEALVRLMHSRECKRNPLKILGYVTTVKFLAAPKPEDSEDILSKAKQISKQINKQTKYLLYLLPFQSEYNN